MLEKSRCRASIIYMLKNLVIFAKLVHHATFFFWQQSSSCHLVCSQTHNFEDKYGSIFKIFFQNIFIFCIMLGVMTHFLYHIGTSFVSFILFGTSSSNVNLEVKLQVSLCFQPRNVKLPAIDVQTKWICCIVWLTDSQSVIQGTVMNKKYFSLKQLFGAPTASFFLLVWLQTKLKMIYFGSLFD